MLAGSMKMVTCGTRRAELLFGSITPYGLKTSTEEKRKGYPGFPTIYEQKSKHTMLEIWRVILNRRFSVQRNDQDRGLLYGNKIKGWKGGSDPMSESNR